MTSDIDGLIVAEGDNSGFHQTPVLPRVCGGAARAMYLGPGLDLAPHLNVATTIAAALEQPFALRTRTPAGQWSPWRPALVSVIPAGMLHHPKALGPMAFPYLHPLTDRRHPMDHDMLVRGCDRLRAIKAGHSLTQAAHMAGFASSAHLSSAFKRMFGLAPSDLLATGVSIDLSDDTVSLAPTEVSGGDSMPGRRPA